MGAFVAHSESTQEDDDMKPDANASQTWGATKTLGPPPSHCPFCGTPIDVVRRTFMGWFEIACQACERTAVISIDDHFKL